MTIRSKQLKSSIDISTEVTTTAYDELQKKVTELTRQIEAMGKVSNSPLITEMEKEDKINQDDYIKVVSLCPMALNLSTLGMGKGKVFKFEKFGDVKRILYSDLVNIMEVHSNFLNDGFFYIMEKRIIDKHGLNESYENILSKETIEEIISGKKDNVVDLFKSANLKQQEFICDIIIEKIQNGQDFDLNLADRISRIAKINIIEKAEEGKKYLTPSA